MWKPSRPKRREAPLSHAIAKGDRLVDSVMSSGVKQTSHFFTRPLFSATAIHCPQPVERHFATRSGATFFPEDFDVRPEGKVV